MDLLAQLLVNGVYVGSVYALLGLSFAIIFATTRIWHFAQGAVYVLGAFGLLVGHRLGLPVAAAFALAVAVAVAAGMLCFTSVYRPLMRRGATPLVMVMASLGLMIVVDNLVVLAFGPTGHSLDVPVPDPVLLGPVFIGGGQMVAPVVAAAIVALYLLLLYRTTLGRRLRALVDNEELLRLNGVRAARLKLVAFALGSALLPVAALLFGLSGAGISPFIGIPAVLTGAMAMFLGGVDTIAGAALAGFLMGIVESVATWLLPTEWQTAVTYGVILLFLVTRPTGLFGRSLPQASV
jgi:branched-chain amino acid transport system permease protein